MPGIGILRDGFDSYNGAGVQVGIASKWTTAGSPSLVAGRFGGQAYRTEVNTLSARAMDSATAAFNLNFGLRVSTVITGSSILSFLMLRSGANYTFGIGVDNNGAVRVYRMTAVNSGVLLGQSADAVVNLGIWYGFEVTGTIHDTTGSVSVWMDGAQVLNLANVDTNNAVGSVDTACISWAGASSAGRVEVDDLYIKNTAERVTKAVRVTSHPVNSDGATLDFTPSTGTSHSAVVGEELASGASYLSGSTVGQKDILGLPDLAINPLTIEEVSVVGYLQKTDAATREMALGVISGATTSDGPNFALNSTGMRHERTMAVDPNTGLAWTKSGFDALQLQPKIMV